MPQCVRSRQNKQHTWRRQKKKDMEQDWSSWRQWSEIFLDSPKANGCVLQLHAAISEKWLLKGIIVQVKLKFNLTALILIIVKKKKKVNMLNWHTKRWAQFFHVALGYSAVTHWWTSLQVSILAVRRPCTRLPIGLSIRRATSDGNDAWQECKNNNVASLVCRGRSPSSLCKGPLLRNSSKSSTGNGTGLFNKRAVEVSTMEAGEKKKGLSKLKSNNS